MHRIQVEIQGDGNRDVLGKEKGILENQKGVLGCYKSKYFGRKFKSYQVFWEEVTKFD